MQRGLVLVHTVAACLGDRRPRSAARSAARPAGMGFKVDLALGIFEVPDGRWGKL